MRSCTGSKLAGHTARRSPRRTLPPSPDHHEWMAPRCARLGVDAHRLRVDGPSLRSVRRLGDSLAALAHSIWSARPPRCAALRSQPSVCRIITCADRGFAMPCSRHMLPHSRFAWHDCAPVLRIAPLRMSCIMQRTAHDARHAPLRRARHADPRHHDQCRYACSTGFAGSLCFAWGALVVNLKVMVQGSRGVDRKYPVRRI